jgi:hypothetical protein
VSIFRVNFTLKMISYHNTDMVSQSEDPNFNLYHHENLKAHSLSRTVGSKHMNYAYLFAASSE